MDYRKIGALRVTSGAHQPFRRHSRRKRQKYARFWMVFWDVSLGMYTAIHCLTLGWNLKNVVWKMMIRTWIWNDMPILGSHVKFRGLQQERYKEKDGSVWPPAATQQQSLKTFRLLLGEAVLKKTKVCPDFWSVTLSNFSLSPRKKSIADAFNCLPIFPLNSSMKRLPSNGAPHGPRPKSHGPARCNPSWSASLMWMASFASFSFRRRPGRMTANPGDEAEQSWKAQWAWWVSNGLGSEWNMMQSSTIIRFFF